MRAPATSDPSKRRSALGVLTAWLVGLVTVLLVLAAVALASSPWWLPLVPDAPSVPWAPALSGGLAVAAALVLAMLGLAGRRRRRRTKEALAWIEGLHLCSSGREPSGSEPVDGTAPADDVSTRVLRMQVRSLEAALEAQQTRVEEVRGEIREAVREARARDRERVLRTVEALRATLADQPGAVALNRLEAALARLGQEPAQGRRLLPTGSTGALPVPLPAPQAYVPAGLPAPEQSAPGAMEVPVETPAAASAAAYDAQESARSAEAGAPVAATPVATAAVPPVVLPVPPRSTVPQPRRPRRRLRRTASV